MQIPSSIKIGGHEIVIERVKPKDIRDHAEFAARNLTIRLDDDYDIPESRQAECLLHEIIEAIKWLDNLELSHNDLTIISEQLFSIIRNNNLDFRKV